MKNANAKSVSAEAASLSDAEMATVLANSNWEKMERAGKNVAAIKEVCEEDFCQDRCA